MQTNTQETPEQPADAGCVRQLVRLAEVTDEIVDAVENEVGMGCGAWDMVSPKEIIAAAWKFMPPTDCNGMVTWNSAIQKALLVIPGGNICDPQDIADSIRELILPNAEHIRDDG